MKKTVSFKNIFGSYVMNMMIKAADEKRKDTAEHEKEARAFEIIDDYVEQA